MLDGFIEYSIAHEKELRLFNHEDETLDGRLTGFESGP
jgi:hypothetical protein